MAIHLKSNIDSLVRGLRSNKFLETMRVTEPLIELWIVVIVVRVLLVDLIEIIFITCKVDEFVNVLCFSCEEVCGIPLQTFKYFQVITEGKVALPDKPISLNSGHHKINDLVMYDPVFLFINIVPILHFFLNLLVHLHKINNKMKNC